MADTLVPLRDNGTFPAVVVEALQDVVGAMLQAGTGATVTYDDATGKVTITCTVTGSGSTDPEVVRDTIAAALRSGPSGIIAVSADDPGDTITIGVDQAVLTEYVQDVIGAMVAAAGGSYNDPAGTITLPTTGGGLTTAQQAHLDNSLFVSVFTSGAYVPARPDTSSVPAGCWRAIGGTQAQFLAASQTNDEWVNA